jgi:hypothetical protein
MAHVKPTYSVSVYLSHESCGLTSISMPLNTVKYVLVYHKVSYTRVLHLTDFNETNYYYYYRGSTALCWAWPFIQFFDPIHSR